MLKHGPHLALARLTTAPPSVSRRAHRGLLSARTSEASYGRMVKGNVGGFIHVGWKGDEASFQRIPRSVIDEEQGNLALASRRLMQGQ